MGAGNHSVRDNKFDARLVQQIIDAGVAICCTDAQGLLCYASEALADLLGVPSLQMHGREVTAFVSDQSRVLAEQILNKARQGIASQADLELMRADASRLWAQVRGYPLLSAEGRCEHIPLCITDITQRVSETTALGEAMERLCEIYRVIDAAIWVAALDGRGITWANPAFMALYGCNEADLYSSSGLWLKAVYPADVERVRAAIAIPAREPYEIEYRVVRPDGQVRWILDHTYPVRDDSGDVVRLVGLAEDVTESREAKEWAERRLRHQEAVNQLSIELGQTLDVDRICRTIYRHVSTLMDANAFIVSLYKADAELIHARYAVADNVERDIAAFPAIPLVRDGQSTQSQVILSGKALYLPDLRSVLDGVDSEHTIRGDGSVTKGPPPKNAERISRSAIYVPMRISGETVGVIQCQSHALNAYAEDDLELLSALANVAAVAIQNARLHQETQRRAERLQIVNRIARAIGAVLRLDDLMETVYQEVSAAFEPDAFLIGLYEEDEHMLDIRILVDAGVRDEPRRVSLTKGLVSHVISTGEPLILNMPDAALERLPEPQFYGTMKAPECWLGVPMRMGDRVIGVISVQSYHGHPYGEEESSWLCTIADQVGVAIKNARLYETLQRELEQRSHLEEQLVQAQKMEAIGRLAGGIAHDFNNLLTVINGYSQLASETVSPDEPIWQDLREIHQAGARAAVLTRQLLAFSRRQSVELNVIDINQVIASMADTLRRLVGDEIELVISLESDLASVRADVGQIEQIVANLASNARDAMPDGGTLRITTQNAWLSEKELFDLPEAKVGPSVLLQVTDNGVGMSEEVRSHLFEPFFTTKGVGQGTGLGLAMLYGSVKQFGGTVTVESQVGEGTTFSIYLPHAEAEIDQAVGMGEPERRERGQETILIVDDHPDVRSLAAHMLDRLGYTILVAESAAAALNLVHERSTCPDLVLTDVVMPGTSGPELIVQLRREYPALRALYMSGYAERAIDQSAAGADDAILHKPFSRDELARRVRQELDR